MLWVIGIYILIKKEIWEHYEKLLPQTFNFVKGL